MTTSPELEWGSGFEQVELSVLTDNDIAIGLYRSVGFVEQGVRRRVWKLDGHYRDIMLMSVLRPKSYEPAESD